MIGFLHLKDITWAATTILELGLLVYLLRRKLARAYPFFVAYVVSTILQSAALAVLYRQSGLSREAIWYLAWGTQGVVTLMRTLALVELTRKILARYAGVWAFARRLLFWVGLGVVAYTLAFSRGMSQWVILNGVRALELAMAAILVTVLLFARYYRLLFQPLPRALAVGFCLYSAFYVINYSVLEAGLQQHAEFWNFLGIVAYLASLLVWVHAVRRHGATVEEKLPANLPPELYGKLSAEVNLRLYLLNRQLAEFMRFGDRRP